MRFTKGVPMQKPYLFRCNLVSDYTFLKKLWGNHAVIAGVKDAHILDQGAFFQVLLELFDASFGGVH
jgi:hypothetical protein